MENEFDHIKKINNEPVTSYENVVHIPLEPPVFYHGTHADVEVPSIKFAKKGAAQYTPAVFIAEDPNLARLSALTGRVQELHLDPNAKLLEFDQLGTLQTENAIREAADLPLISQEEWERENESMELNRGYPIINRDIYYRVGSDIGTREFAKTRSNENQRAILHDALRQVGYDGFRYSAMEESSNIPFYGNAIALLRDGFLKPAVKPASLKIDDKKNL